MKNIALLLPLFLFGCSVTMIDLPASNNTDIIERAKSSIKYNLKDPNSAQFRSISVREQQGESVKVVCGQVNGTNSYGGYSGFKGFYYSEYNNAGKVHTQQHIVTNVSGLENSTSNFVHATYCF